MLLMQLSGSFFYLLQSLIKTAYGESHDIIEAAFNAFDAHHANPFLYAVGSSLVVGLVVVDIIVDYLFREMAETDMGAFGKRDRSLQTSEADTRIDLMHIVREVVQHGYGRLASVRLAQNPIVMDHHSVGCQQYLSRLERSHIALRLTFSQELGNLRSGRQHSNMLIDIDIDNAVFESE